MNLTNICSYRKVYYFVRAALTREETRSSLPSPFVWNHLFLIGPLPPYCIIKFCFVVVVFIVFMH